VAGEEIRVLIVDDDVPIRQVLADVLADTGYTVIEAIHGAHALEVLADTPVDLVISDMMMPLVDGVSLCQRVKAMGSTAVILMSSAPAIAPLGAGEDGFIAKPFDLDALERLISTVLSGRAGGEP
jgi:two-component system response regulator MprA